MNTPSTYLQVVRIMRVAPRAGLKKIDNGKIQDIQATIELFQSQIEDPEFGDDKKPKLEQQLAFFKESLEIAKTPFEDLFVAVSLEYTPDTGSKVPVTSKLVDLSSLFKVKYYSRDLMEQLVKNATFQGSVLNVYSFNNEIGVYEDLNCGGLFRSEKVYTFSTESEKVIRCVIRGNGKERKYCRLLPDNSVDLLDIISFVDDQPEVTGHYERLPNAGSILCVHEIEPAGDSFVSRYYKFLDDGSKGEEIIFDQPVLRKLRTVYTDFLSAPVTEKNQETAMRLSESLR